MRSSSRVLSLLASMSLILFPSAGASAQEADKPSQTALISAYVGPSVVFVDTTWKATVHDPYNKSYVTETAKSNKAKIFTMHSYCTGFIVNADGYVATAGHCVDPKEVELDFLEAGAGWALETGYFKNGTVDELVKDQVSSSGASRKTERERSKNPSQSPGAPRRISNSTLAFTSFKSGQKAMPGLLKIEADNLPAVKLAQSERALRREPKWCRSATRPRSTRPSTSTTRLLTKKVRSRPRRPCQVGSSAFTRCHRQSPMG